MRTTIELSEEQRAELLRLAAQRGQKGFSALIQEALDGYLKQQAEKKHFIQAAIDLQGSFAGKAADEFAARVESVRENWR
jgi:hypothetical protein